MTVRGKDIKFALHIEGPCYKCLDRHPACHSSCKKYETYRETLDEYNDKYRKQRSLRR